MKRLLVALAFFLAVVGTAGSQQTVMTVGDQSIAGTKTFTGILSVGGQIYIPVCSTDPQSGSCTTGDICLSAVRSSWYICPAGTWTEAAGGGGGSGDVSWGGVSSTPDAIPTFADSSGQVLDEATNAPTITTATGALNLTAPMVTTDDITASGTGTTTFGNYYVYFTGPQMFMTDGAEMFMQDGTNTDVESGASITIASGGTLTTEAGSDVNFANADDFQIPFKTTPTTDVAGEMAFDSDCLDSGVNACLQFQVAAGGTDRFLLPHTMPGPSEDLKVLQWNESADSYDWATVTGSTVWDFLGSDNFQVDLADDVVIGAATAVSGAKFSVDGDGTDQIQGLIQGTASPNQATDLFVVEDSTGVDYFTVQGPDKTPGPYVTVKDTLTQDGTGPLTLGDATTTIVTIEADGDADVDLVLPLESVGPAEIDKGQAFVFTVGGHNIEAAENITALLIEGTTVAGESPALAFETDDDTATTRLRLKNDEVFAIADESDVPRFEFVTNGAEGDSHLGILDGHLVMADADPLISLTTATDLPTDALTFRVDSDNATADPIAGAGFIIEGGSGSDKSLLWDATNAEFDLNDDLAVTGTMRSTAVAAPAAEFDDSDFGNTVDGSIAVNCPTTLDCDMDFAVDSGGDTPTVVMKLDTTDAGATTVQMGTPGTNYVNVTEAGVVSFVGTGDIDLPTDALDAATEVATTLCTANQVLKKNAGDTAWECAADSTGGTPSFDAITTGTNAAATMTVGTGASMTTSGSGTITATAVPASGVSGTDAGTDLTADLEEETHASEHAENAADELLGEGLGTACTVNQILKSDGAGGLDCAADATGGSPADLNDIGNVNLTTPGDGAVLCFTGTSNASVDCAVGGDATATENAGELTIAVTDDLHDHVITNIDTFTKTALEDQISDISDLAEADGEVWTGTHDFGGVSAFEIMNDAAPTVDAAGETAIDTTDDQLVYYGAAKRVLAYEQTACAVFENLAAADDNYEIYMARDAVTITGVGCHCRGTCSTGAQVSLEDRSGNAMTHTTPTCSTGTGNTTFQAVTAANGLVAGEGLAFDVDNAVSPETDEYTVCFSYTVDAQ